MGAEESHDSDGQPALPFVLRLATLNHPGWRDFLEPPDATQPDELGRPFLLAARIVADRALHPERESFSLMVSALVVCASGIFVLSIFSIGIGAFAGWLQGFGVLGLAGALATSKQRLRFLAFSAASLVTAAGTGLDTGGDWSYAPLAYLLVTDLGLYILTLGLVLGATSAARVGDRAARLARGLSIVGWGCVVVGVGNLLTGLHALRVHDLELAAGSLVTGIGNTLLVVAIRHAVVHVRRLGRAGQEPKHM